MNFKVLAGILLLFLLVGGVQAVTWTDTGFGCWTATDGNYLLVKWIDPGTHSIILPADTSVEYLVVGGGASGGGTFNDGGGAGGGGAGGFVNGSGFAASGLIPVTVGAAGATTAAARVDGNDGGSSIFSTLTAHGGSGGGKNDGVGRSGGSSGGGAGTGGYAGGTTGFPLEGFDGGASTAAAPWFSAGGGGGAGSIGQTTPDSANGGDGGAGLSTSIDGTNTWYSGGGGGGGGFTDGGGAAGTGGSGIGGAGGQSSSLTSQNGFPATGYGSGGGGGDAGTGGATSGGAGSSGIVIIKYLSPYPIASFTQNKTGGSAPLVVLFTDTSINRPKVWNWSVNASDWSSRAWFNYTASTNLVHTFATPGLYNVTLSVQNITDSPSISTKQIDILINGTLQADFVGAPTAGVFVPQSVSFVDFSTGEGLYAWDWNFGDGSTSIIRNPTHIYNQAGSFTVTLQTSGIDGTSTKAVPNYIVVGTGGGFTANQTSNYKYGMPVYFNDTAPGGHTGWVWNFGDGYTSILPNASHIYSVARSYTVSMVAIDPFGTNTTTKVNYVDLYSDDDTYLKSWLHFNGQNGGTIFNGEKGNAWTSNLVTTSNTRVKFGNASGLFSSTSSYLNTPSSSIFDMGTGDFAKEMWVYPTSTGTNYNLYSRTNSAKSAGWGIYHGSGATSADWHFFGGSTATQTSAFSLPLNTWSHLSVQRKSGLVSVYVNGMYNVSATLAGNYDTTNPIRIGDIGGGTNRAFQGYVDEFRESTGTVRWDVDSGRFSTPYAEYVGNISASFVTINPGSTLRYKTNPDYPGAIMNNMTARYRTMQIQYVNITDRINATMIYNPNHFTDGVVIPNVSALAGITVTYYKDDPILGQIEMGLDRTGGFSTIGLTEGRLSVADVRMLYWNYTESHDHTFWDEHASENVQYFSNGFLTNITSGVIYPVHNFIGTNITVLDWITYAKFTANNTAPIIDESPVFFTLENNQTTSETLWDFGDGTPVFTSYNTSEVHIYPASGGITPKTVTAIARLWQNQSVTNTTTRVAYITPTYNLTYVNADFTGNPISGLPGLFVTFTDKTVYGNTTALKIYNWSYGDGTFSNTVGSTSHVYAYLGTYSVTLTVNNTANVTLGSDTLFRENYIVISSNQNQQNTWWTPHTVQVNIFDTQGTKLPNVLVNAHYNETAMPAAWVTEMYGIQATPAADLFNKSLIMSGTTGGDGTVTFTMLGSLKYNLNLTSSKYGLTCYPVDVFPSDAIVNIYVPTLTASLIPTSQNSTYTALNQTRVYLVEPNISYVSMCIDYKDASGLTTEVTNKWYFTNNNTLMHTSSFVPNTALVTRCYDIENIRGTSVWWGWNATRSE